MKFKGVKKLFIKINIKEYISSDNLVIEEDSHQVSDHRLNTTPMRTFSIKQNNNKVYERGCFCMNIMQVNKIGCF